MALLTPEQQRQVEEAVTRAELHTDAEIVTVLAPRADDYSYIPLLWASLIALVVPAVVHFLNSGLTTYTLLMLQWASFVFLSLIFRLPAITTRLIPPRVRHWRASNLARRQFLEQKLHHTAGRTGVLIFVSEAERYVEILVDEGISRHLDNSDWGTIVNDFVRRVALGHTAEGFITCIDACAEVLKQHVPKTQTRNQLPNRLVML
ncbi:MULTISPECIES: TPM domain-containing protein [unclassified Pseudomonas]|jgi:putative membrane protein|uniref:TPM domain-containing protein n=1 Tax=unclassified Pseudomonas TaxID=196821 RepID=UPI0010567DDD|nr:MULTISPECIES: TPM domain-containing protein [unclassified Pseudomonas]MBW3505077.1 TPM domain-containing protein [Pseudomonas sp. NKUCC02_KPG]MEC4166865.1 TPM domain-containing protein [Pseudomonas sp. MS-1(2024)]